MKRFHTEEKDKRTEFEELGYQHKDKKTRQIKNERSPNESQIQTWKFTKMFNLLSTLNTFQRNRALALELSKVFFVITQKNCNIVKFSISCLM